jgi:hypothetical protein
MKTNATWVIYKMNIPGHIIEANAVCEQKEWEALERARPGRRILLQGGIPSEPEAEKLARTLKAAA